MEGMSAAIRAMRLPSRICRQCRSISGAAPTRYSERTSTRGLADDLLRAVQKRPARTQTATATTDGDAASSAGLTAASSSTPSAAQSRPPSFMEVLRAKTAAQRVDEGMTGKELEGQMNRKFVPGDVYSPHDIGRVEQLKWGQLHNKPRTKIDIVDKTGVDFVREYKNIALMQEFVSSGGRIKHNKQTGFRPKNQRKMSKAVKRAAGIGLIPKTYRHPELLMRVPQSLTPHFLCQRSDGDDAQAFRHIIVRQLDDASCSSSH